MFSEEKVLNEVALMRYIHDQTPIPVPFVLPWDVKDEGPLELSHFVLMNYFKHNTTMFDLLNAPGRPKTERGILDPNIHEENLKALYGELARALLQLPSL